jgi:cyclohexadienyl dehydratase
VSKTAAVLSLAFGLGLSGMAAAQSPTALDGVMEKKALRVCTTGDYKPFTYQAPGSDGFEGIDIDLAKSLAKSLGAEAVFVKTKWSDLMADFTSGKCDTAMGGISVTLDRQKRAYFSTAYLVNGKAPIARCADKAKYTSVKAINDPSVRVVVNPGGTNERFARASFPDAKLTLYPDNNTIFDLILKNEADVMVAESIEVKVQEKLRPGLCAINPDEPLQYGELGYLLPRGDDVFKAYVDQWLHLAKATGEFARVYDAHVK